MPRRSGLKKMVRRRPGAKRRGGYKKNRYATKTYNFKRWTETVYLQNSDTDNPSKIINSDPTQLQTSSTVSDLIPGTLQFGANET